jgi:hypothetical protein
MHQPASEKAKDETKPRFHAGRLDAVVSAFQYCIIPF